MSKKKKRKKRKNRRKRNSKNRRKKNSKKIDVRLVLTDKAWKQIAEVLVKIKRKDGSPPKIENRLFIEAVLYVARTGIPWRDLPKCFGRWEAIYNRLRRWEEKGLWRKLWEQLQQKKYKTAKIIFIDSTIVRAHQHAAGAPNKRGGQEAQALGRSRGGFTTKIHCACIDESTGVSFILTGGQRHDAPIFDEVFDELPEENCLEEAAMDRGYDSNHIREKLENNEVTPVIPPRKNRKEEIYYDKETYKLRNKVERIFNKMKHFRRIATRYEKLSCVFLAFIHIVAVVIGIR